MNFHAAQKNVTVTSISPPKNKTDLTVFDSLDHFNLDSLPLLLPEESYAAVFHVSKEIGTCIKVVGNPEIKWCTYMGEHGLVTGSEVVLTSSTMISTNASQQQQEIEDMIYIDCISSPLTVYKGKEFEIILRVTNNKNKSTMMQLICKDMVASSYSNSIDQIIPIRDQTLNTKKDINTPSGQGDNLKILNDKNGSQLFVTGSSKKNLGEIRNGEFVDISVKVCAVDFGLQELKGVSVIDKNTSKEYTSKSLVKVMVISNQPQN